MRKDPLATEALLQTTAIMITGATVLLMEEAMEHTQLLSMQIIQTTLQLLLPLILTFIHQQM